MDWFSFQNKSKGKGKVFLMHATTSCGIVIEPWYYMEVGSQLHYLDALLPRKEPLVPIEQEDEWTPELICMPHRTEKYLALLRIK
jgi:hypothetical protein